MQTINLTIQLVYNLISRYELPGLQACFGVPERWGEGLDGRTGQQAAPRRRRTRRLG